MEKVTIVKDFPECDTKKKGQPGLVQKNSSWFGRNYLFKHMKIMIIQSTNDESDKPETLEFDNPCTGMIILFKWNLSY